MFNIDEEKDRVTKKLSEQYSQNILTMEEFERILEYINKIKTNKEISIIEKIINENTVEENNISIIENYDIMIPHSKEKHLSTFSWKSTNINPKNGYGGKFISVFGANRIIVDNLPIGRTIINVNSVFGLTEIIIPENVKIVNKIFPVFSGIFTPNVINNENVELPELYIVGKAIFANITVLTVEEFNKQLGG